MIPETSGPMLRLASQSPPALEKLLVSDLERRAAEGSYWNLDHFYVIDAEAVERVLVPAVSELWDMCLRFVARAVEDDEILTSLGIPECAWSGISSSWRNNDPAPIARFDLSFDGKSPPKLHECNIDVVGLLYESAFFQKAWTKCHEAADAELSSPGPFLPIEDGFTAAIEKLGPGSPVSLMSINADPYEELWICAVARMLEERSINYQLENFDSVSECLSSIMQRQGDAAGQLAIKAFRWDLLLPHGEAIRSLAASTVRLISPMWSLVLSSKGSLPWLWKMNPGHCNLLEAHFDPERLHSSAGVVSKPLFSIQGQNISLEDRILPIRNVTTPGAVQDASRIYQELCYLPDFSSDDGRHWASTGAWVANGRPAGITITECSNPVITELSMRYVPHILR